MPGLHIQRGNGGISIGDPIRLGTSGSVLFVDSSGFIGQDNANLYWDDSNNRLGIGTNAPGQTLHVKVDQDGTTNSYVENASTGTSAITQLLLQNTGNYFVGFRQYGVNKSSTLAGINLAGLSAIVSGSSSTGLLINTSASVPIYSAINSTVVTTVNATGLGIGITPTFQFHMSKTWTALADNDAQAQVLSTVTLSGSSSGDLIGFGSTVTFDQNGFNATDGTNAARGLQGAVTVSGSSGTVTFVTGFQAQVSNTGTGTITNGSCVYANLRNTAGGTFTNAHGLYVVAPSGGTNVTNFYGVRVLPATTGTNIFAITSTIAAASQRWNLYIDGTAQNYFAGKVGLAVTTPTNDLSFGGDAARTIWSERNTTTAGSNLTVQSGGALSGGTDLAGGSLILSSGTSTGTGTSSILFKTSSDSATGTSDNAPATKMTLAATNASGTTNLISIAETLPTTRTGASVAITTTITTAGSSAFAINGELFSLAAGFTGAANTQALSITNAVAGTIATYSTASYRPNGNISITTQATATTTGINTGLRALASNGNVNYAIWASATVDKNSATNVGVVGIGLNAGTTPTYVGGYFACMSQAGIPTFANAALMANNGGTTGAIFLGQDNATTVFSIIDGGNVGIGTASPGFPLEVVGAASISTSITTPVIIGGTGTGSSLTLQSTSGVGATDTILFKVGNNGATTSMTIDTAGRVGINVAPTTYALSVLGGTNTTARFYANTTGQPQVLTVENIGNALTDRGVAILFGVPLSAARADGGQIAVAEESAAATTYMTFSTATTGTLSEKVRITSGGLFGIGCTPTNSLSFSGQAARSLGSERNTTSNTAGNNLTIFAGGATSGATDKNGGTLNLSAGVSTGTGVTSLQLSTYAVGTTGTSDNTGFTVVTIRPYGMLFNNNLTAYNTVDASPYIMGTANTGTYPYNSAGNLVIQGRPSASADIVLATGTPAVANFVLKGSGKIGLFGVTAPTNDISLDGQSNRVIWLERHTTADTAGNQLSLIGGGAASGATNKAGGTAALIAGVSTGSGTSAVKFYVYGTIAASTSDNAQVRAGLFQPWNDSGTDRSSFLVDGLLQLNNNLAAYTTDTTVGATPRIYSSSTAGSSYPFQAAGHLVIQGRPDAGRDIVFATGTTPTTRMFITSAGNIGIGITTGTASQMLHITGGNIQLSGTSPAFTSTTTLQIGGNRTSPVAGNIVFGDGTGWKLHIGKGTDDAATQWVTFQDNGRVGIGVTATTPTATLDVINTITASMRAGLFTSTFTDPASAIVVLKGDSNITLSANNALQMTGTQGTARLVGAGFDLTNSTAGLISGWFQSTVTSGAGTVTGSIGAFGTNGNASTGTLSNAYGIYTYNTNTSSGTLTTGYGVYVGVSTNSGGGTFGTNTGIHIAAQTVGSTAIHGIRSLIAAAATRWNIFIDGTAQNHFRGNVGIGTGSTTPEEALVINAGKLVLNDTGYATSKFNSQGVDWATVGTEPHIIINSDSTSRAEISWIRGSRTYPEFSIRQHTSADSGGQFWAGPGTVAPTLTMTVGAGKVGFGVTAPAHRVDISGGLRFSPITISGALTAALAGLGAGNLTNGAYTYSVTFVNPHGETGRGTSSNTLTVVDATTNGQAALSAIPTSTDPTVTARNIYRTAVGGIGSWLLTTISDNTTTTYTDNISDATLKTGALGIPHQGTASGAIYTGTTERKVVALDGSGIRTTFNPARSSAFTGDQQLLTSTNTRANAVFVYNNGYLYVITGSGSNNVYYINVGSLGRLDLTWSTDTVFPVSRCNAAGTAVGGYIYVIGGTTASTTSVFTTGTSTVYFGRPNPDGTVSSWQTTTALPAAVSAARCVAYNGYLYVIGGANTSSVAQTSVYYGKINPDGTVTTWNTSANTLPVALIYHGLAVLNGYLYVYGGRANNAGSGMADNNLDNQSATYFTLVDTSTGDVAAWSTSAQSLGVANAILSSYSLNGYIVAAGGVNTAGASTSVNYFARPQDLGISDTAGEISAWTTNGANTGSSGQNYAAVAGNYVFYHIGGSAVRLMTPPVVRIAGDLDLLAETYRAHSIAGGAATLSGGGSLQCLNVSALGEIRTLGTLQVQGMSYFSDAIGVRGSATKLLYIDGQSDHTIGMARNFTANTAGNDLTIEAGGATAGATNKSGGVLYLTGGVSTGSGTGQVIVQTYPGTAGSTTDNTALTAFTVDGSQITTFSGHVRMSSAIDIQMAVSDTTFSGIVSGTSRAGSRQAIFFNHDGSATFNSMYLGSAFELVDGVSSQAPTYKNAGSSSVTVAILELGHSGLKFHTAPAAAVGTVFVPTTYMTISNAGATTFAGKSHAFNSGANGDIQATGSATTSAGGTAVRPCAAFHNGYIYRIGGDDAVTVITTIQYAQVASDGTIASWSTEATNSLPLARTSAASCVANGYIYVLGGKLTTSQATAATTVYYCKPNPDGSLGTWGSTTVLPSALTGHKAVYYNGYIYVAGGANASSTIQSAVYYAKVNADGTIGSWITATNALGTAINLPGMAVANGVLYVFGGTTTGSATNGVTTVNYSIIGSDNSPGTWTASANSLNTAETAPGVVVANGYLYCIGGVNTAGSSSTVFQYTALASSGDVGAWTTSSFTMGGAATWDTFHLNGLILGGNNNNVGYRLVQVNKLQAATSVDLLGLSSSFLTRGGDGSSIHAGDIYSNSNLVVLGYSQFEGPTQFSSALGLTGRTSPLVASGNGIAGGTTFSVVAATGGIASSTSNVTAGLGGIIAITAGTGGAATGASGSNIGGAGGTIELIGGTGGAATSGTAGVGGNVHITGGNSTGTVGNVILAYTIAGGIRGLVGIGMVSPAYMLDVGASSNGAIRANQHFITGNNISAFNSTETQSLIYGTSNGGGAYPFLTSGNLILQSRPAGANRDIVFVTSTTQQVTMMIDGTNQRIGMFGLTTPTNSLSFSGQAARTIWMERHTTADTAGNTLTIQSGGATSGATNKSSGALILAPGLSTGTGQGNVRVQAPNHVAAGTGDSTLIDRHVYGKKAVLTNDNSTLTTLVTCTLATDSVVAGIIRYAVEVVDGSHVVQLEAGEFVYTVTNSNGSIANNTVTFPTGYPKNVATSGSLTLTFAISTAASPLVTVKCNSSLSASSGYPRISYSIENLTNQAVS